MLGSADTLLEVLARGEGVQEARVVPERLLVSSLLEVAPDGAGLLPLRAPLPPQIAGYLLDEDLLQPPHRPVVLAQVGEELVEGGLVLLTLPTPDDELAPRSP